MVAVMISTLAAAECRIQIQHLIEDKLADRTSQKLFRVRPHVRIRIF
jgi:hypothetical protein